MMDTLDLVRRKVLGWGKKIFQYERGLEIWESWKLEKVFC